MGFEKDDFWDLGKPREKKYAKPDFSGHTIDTTEIKDENAESPNAEVASAEKIGPRGHLNLSIDVGGEKKTLSASFWIDPIGGKRVVTSSYKRHATVKKREPMQNAMTDYPKYEENVKTYTPLSVLIKRIDVKKWAGGSDFYGRFNSDAVQSYHAESIYSVDEKVENVPYYSFVPQYAHMNMAQVEFYRWIRANVRLGRYPECDYPYIQLLIFEIINLPNEIEPSDALELLAKIWTGYREQYPRIDSCLAEWIADFCMINGLSFPDSLIPLLPDITSKAQFKEFYIDSAIKNEGNGLGQILASAVSDYDYLSSRYYEENREMFDKHIVGAIDCAARAMLAKKTEPFTLEKIYRLTRDSFCGAIAATNIKRRLDIDFCSFTRSADARQLFTSLVKYSENRVREMCGIKARLNVDRVNEAAIEEIDRYFAPIAPDKKKIAEDKYMPADYMKNYEAETSGFDFDRAKEIENLSWINTERLTGEEYISADLVHENAEIIEGEYSFDDTIQTETDNSVAAEQSEDSDNEILLGLKAALDGKFREFSKELGAFEGELADRINTFMLDIIGDTVLENIDGRYELIEDYREDVEQWIQEQH